MRKIKSMKILFVIIMTLIIGMSVMGTVSAETYQDLNQAINGNNASGNSTATNNSSSAGNNTSGGASGLNSATNNVLTTNSSNTANTSTYNNASLPKTGISDSLPIVVLVVVFGISAVYAYKKIRDYRNI